MCCTGLADGADESLFLMRGTINMTTRHIDPCAEFSHMLHMDPMSTGMLNIRLCLLG